MDRDEAELTSVVGRCLQESFVDGLVGILELHVLPYEGDAYLLGSLLT